MKKVKILIAEDHVRYRKTLAGMLNVDARFNVIGETADGNHAVFLCSELDPDVVIMDVVLDGQDGIEATKQIKQKTPHVKVIGLSLYNNERQQVQMLSSGASAYLDKRCSLEQIAQTIVQVQTGQHL
jgi:NarL family two-component system response regulator LiaR